MSKVKFEDGTVVNFKGTPTPQDVEEVAQQLGKNVSGVRPITTTTTPETTQPIGSTALQKLSTFLKGEVSGMPEKTGILGDIFQTTVGSKGILGTAEMIPRAFAQKGVLRDVTGATESVGKLSEMTANLIRQKRTMTDPTQISKVSGLISDNVKRIKELGGDVSQLQKAILTPKEAVATLGRTAITLAPFAKVGGIGLQTAAQSKAAPSILKAGEAALNIPARGGGLVGSLERIGIRAGESGLTSAGFGGFTAYGEQKPAKEIARTAASYGLTGLAIGGIIQTGAEAIGAIKDGLRMGASKIQVSRLSPNKADMADVKAVSKEEAANILKGNIEKYGLYGNAHSVAEKSENQLSDLNNQLKDVLTGSEKKVNLGDVFDKTEEAMRADQANNLKIGISKIDDAFESIKSDILDVYGDKTTAAGQKMIFGEAIPEEGLAEKVAGKTELDLVKANALKRLSGTGGAWEYGRYDPDATAKEKVWNYLYSQLKQAIEQADPGETQEIQQLNKQMSEIIPIYRMALRRIPPEAKASSLSLKTLIGLGFSFTNPKALALVALDLASRSGRMAGILSGVGGVAEKISGIPPAAVVSPSMILSRILQRSKEGTPEQSDTQEELRKLLEQQL